MSSTPLVKFEAFEQSPADSLAESFSSIPGQQYPSLFSSQSAGLFEALTPQSYDEDHDASMYGDDFGDMAQRLASTPQPEKKPVKKRKSWGQQLPEPKTNLPPRKRAKTEDEKEQRRVERVLRNRRAAQSSRERKRKEVEALEAEKQQIERKNIDLELQLANLTSKCADLEQKLQKATGMPLGNLPDSHVASTEYHPKTFASQTPIALTKTLRIDLRDPEPESTRPMMMSSDAHYSMQSAMATVNPSSLSPPPMDDFEASFDASSLGMTQHSAAMLCDLQCQPKEQRPRVSSSLISTRVIAINLWFQVALTAISTILHPLEEIRASLMTSSALSPTPRLITLIIWLTTTTSTLTIPTGSTSSTKTRSHSLRPKSTLRIRLLRRLLACSPNLARPLLDATLEAMRLPSKQQLARDCLNGAGLRDLRDGEKSSSFESLMTLSWAIKVIMKEQAQAQTQTISEPDAVMAVGQSCEQLKELFETREIGGGVGRKVIMNLASRVNGDTLGQKSLDGQWSTALEDEPSS